MTKAAQTPASRGASSITPCPCNDDCCSCRRRPCSDVTCLLADLGAAGELAGLLVHSHPHAAVLIPELCWPRSTHQILQSTRQLFGLPL